MEGRAHGLHEQPRRRPDDRTGQWRTGRLSSRPWLTRLLSGRSTAARSTMTESRPPGWLPKEEFLAIYRRVPRLCVEVVILEPARGVLLKVRDIPPNEGAWHIPGGTVLFGEPLVEAVKRVARDELGLEAEAGPLLGYIEYP